MNQSPLGMHVTAHLGKPANGGFHRSGLSFSCEEDFRVGSTAQGLCLFCLPILPSSPFQPVALWPQDDSCSSRHEIRTQG